MTATHLDYQQQLIDLARATPWLMRALAAARSLQLSQWCIGAGAVRNVVWEHLHGRDSAAMPEDIDLAYFDSDLTSARDELLLQDRLHEMAPELPFEVTNQARVHQWYAEQYGIELAPYTSLEQALASWPEYATCIGLRLLQDDEIEVIAPYGLGDLFTLQVRHNPVLVSAQMYTARLIKKGFQQRWPKVVITRAVQPQSATS